MPVDIKDVTLFEGLSKKELDLVQKRLREENYEKGDILFSEGAGCDRIFIVREGRVKVFRTSPGGREQILEILKGGDSCACNPGSSTWFCSASAEALTSCRVWFLSRIDYVEMVKTSTQIAHTLNQIFAEKLQCLSSLVEEVSLKDAKKRLIKFLLDMLREKTRKTESNNTLFIPFTREEIAQRLGTARETVARYLSQLKQERLIEIKPYQIVILDKKGLEDQLRS